MRVHLVDGTYELFRHFFAVPSSVNDDGEEVGATRGVLNSVLFLLANGVTHVGVATDHVIESFRNRLWPGYKTGEGVAPELKAQFPLLEDALRALGVTVWAMVEEEADDALAAAASAAAGEPDVEQVVICTPDKDLAQCVRGQRVVQLDRRKQLVMDEDGVWARFGVGPGSIPDYLALVGDSADGFPGLPGWGAKSAAAVLAVYGHVEDVPAEPGKWEVPVRGAKELSRVLEANRELVALFKDLATLRTGGIGWEGTDALRWRGPTPSFLDVARRLKAPDLVAKAETLSSAVGGG